MSVISFSVSVGRSPEVVPAVACTRYQVLGSDFSAIPSESEPSISPGPMESSQTCLGSIIHWLVHRLSVASHCIGQIQKISDIIASQPSCDSSVDARSHRGCSIISRCSRSAERTQKK